MYFENELSVSWRKHFNKLIICSIEYQFFENKFEFLVDIVRGCVDKLLICKINFDERFPMSQLKIEGINAPFRLDCDSSGSGIMLHVREDTPAKLLIRETTNNRGLLCRTKFKEAKMVSSKLFL